MPRAPDAKILNPQTLNVCMHKNSLWRRTAWAGASMCTAASQPCVRYNNCRNRQAAPALLSSGDSCAVHAAAACAAGAHALHLGAGSL